MFQYILVALNGARREMTA